jgi:hypothetical protein
LTRSYAMLALLGLALAASSPAGAADRGPKACFLPHNVNGYRYVAPRTVNLRVGVNDIYQVTTLGDCRDINFSEAIGLESRGGGFICSGLDVTLVAPSPIGPRRCAATNLRRLTPEEAAALPEKQRP